MLTDTRPCPRFDLAAPDVTDATAIAALLADRTRAGILAMLRDGPALRVRDGRDVRRAREQRQQPPREAARCGPRPRQPPRRRRALDLLRARRGGHRRAPRRRCRRSCDDHARRSAARIASTFWSGSPWHGHRRLARRLGPAGARGRLAHDRRPGPGHQPRASAPRSRSSCSTCPRCCCCSSASSPLVSFLRSFVSPERVRRTLAGRNVVVGRDRRRRLRHHHAVLLLLRGAAVHRLRGGGRAARRHVRVPHRRRRWSTRSRSCCCGACSARPSRSPTWSPG